MPETNRYVAFISYRHLPADRKWASWLLEQIESFKTPRSLVAVGIPATAGRVFRDEDEIPASPDLNDQIEAALRVSDNLIVVASTATPASLWIDREVRFFQEMGRGDRIHVLLIDGDPETAFPAALLSDEREPVAADVRPRPDTSENKLKEFAKFRILAALLGCSFDDLRRRDQIRRRRRIMAIVGGAVAAASIIGGFAIEGARRQYSVSLEQQLNMIDRQRHNSLARVRAVFGILPDSNLLRAEVPQAIREAILLQARWGAVRRVAMTSEVYPYSGPSRLWTTGEDAVLVGMYDGSVWRVTGDGDPEPLAPRNCGEGDAGFVQRCAVTAIAFDPGSRTLLYGTMGGQLQMRSPSGAVVLSLSQQRVAHILNLADGRFLVADGDGSLDIASPQGVQPIPDSTGSVVALLERGDQVLVVRRNGRVERLQDWRLSPVFESADIIIGAVVINDELVLLTRSTTADASLEGRMTTTRHDGVILINEEINSLDVNGGHDAFVASGRGDSVLSVGNQRFTRIDLASGTTHVIEFLNRSESYSFADPFASPPRYFMNTVAVSGDGRRLFTADASGVNVINLEDLAEIDAMVLRAPNLRAALCNRGLGDLFSESPEDDVC